MSLLDWVVIGVYISALVAAAAVLGRSQSAIDDYYLAGKRVSWWESGLSTMASQLGAISFISAPAFVALKDDGGLKWLAYEFGVPLALILVMAIIIPVLHRRDVMSIYEYLEARFDEGTRVLASLLFQVGRGLATAVSVLVGGLIISTALGISTTMAILTMGLVTIIYDIFGGIRAVILSDVIQMGIIFLGLLVCAGAAVALAGWDAAWSQLEPGRREILDFSRWGFEAGGTYAFWPMTLGGFFLYASYYGCDQSQVQRELTVKGIDNVRKSLLVNAFGRFPIVLLYSIMGVFVGAAVVAPGFLDRGAEVLGSERDVLAAQLDRDPDRMVPLFILTTMPHGIIGLFFVAVLSALMSNLDSALNSMSAVTMRDFYQRYWNPDRDRAHYLRVSKLFTLLWGVFCVGFALVFAASPEATRQTTIVLINAVGSVIYGPLLAAFLLGMVTNWAGPYGTKIGVVTGVALNIMLWIFTPVSWLWWNLTGFVAAVCVAAVLSGRDKARRKTVYLRPPEPTRINWPLVYTLVVGYFFVIVGICALLEPAG